MKNEIYKHLKLDKFINGSEQRIFKTTTKLIDTKLNLSAQLMNLELNMFFSETYRIQFEKNTNNKNIFYGKYSSNLIQNITDTKYENSLINFHQINYDYINNRPDKINSITKINDFHNPTFANKVQENSYRKPLQKIEYFPEYIHTPIDITNFNNLYYFLIPINTNRYVNIPHPNDILSCVETLSHKDMGKLDKESNSYKIPYKNNYTQVLKQFFDKGIYTPEDNAITIYDLNMTYLQTIKFNSSSDLFNWILKWQFQSIIYEKDNKFVSLLQEILFDSKNQKSYIDGTDLNNYDSIKTFNLIDYLLRKKYLYSNDTIKSILIDLLSNLSKNSICRFFNPIGKINTLSTSIISSFITDNTYNQDFKDENIFILKELLTRKQATIFNNQGLPENTLIVGNTLFPLFYNENIYEFPSCYVNYVHLKNNKNPEHEIECYIKDLYPSGKNKDYIINDILSSTTSGYISSDINFSDKNQDIYEFDGRFSIEYNLLSSYDQYTITKNTCKYILNYSEKKDNQYVQDYNSLNLSADILPTSGKEQLSALAKYIEQNPIRMNLKKENYLAQYYNDHICHNKIYNMGTLLGIRNYIKSDTTTNNTLWLSYKYNSTQYSQQEILSSFSLPFYKYNTNRKSNWDDNIIMKNSYSPCPWTTKIQSGIIHCTLSSCYECKGYCTFPYNKTIKKINNDNNGINWNVSDYFINSTNYNFDINLLNNNLNINNSEFFIIPNSNYKTYLEATSDIQVYDDIQIFLLSALTDTILDNFKTNMSLKTEFKSIHNGFGRNNLEDYQKEKLGEIVSGDPIYPEILFKNQNSTSYKIAPNCNFNGPHIIPKGTRLHCYNVQTNQIVDEIPANYYTLLRIKNWWSDYVYATGSFKQIIINENKQYITNILNRYDYLEAVNGFYKFKQKGLHKSNIYSINLANTGVNPASDKIIKYYTKSQIIDILIKKYNLFYNENKDAFLTASKQNLFVKTHFDVDKNKIRNNNTIYNDTPLFKPLSDKLSGFVLYNNYISFDYLIEQQKLITYFDKEKNEILYYYQFEKTNNDQYNEIRQNIRNLLEQAIRDSITKYMPADTTLWKIKYSGE